MVCAASLALGALALGCAQAGPGDGAADESVSDTNAVALSFEEFKASHFFRDPTDPTVLLLHGDVAVEVDSAAGARSGRGRRGALRPRARTRPCAGRRP